MLDNALQAMSSLSKLVQDRVESILGDALHVVVAFSGGLDSTVLLHACAELRKRQAANNIKRRWQAVHVNHQLSQNADEWARHCDAFCLSQEIPFETVVVSVERDSASLEASAREARYAALDKFLKKDSLLLTAHQADDQAETVLLRLMRGAGAAGLRAVHQRRIQGKGELVRPLLDLSRQVLKDYAKGNGLSWIDDESNDDLKFDRNYLRKEVIPNLKTRWPNVVNALQTVAEQASEQQSLLDEFAQQDLKVLVSEQAGFGPSFNLGGCAQLGVARAKNALRSWLHKHDGVFNREQWRQFESFCHEPTRLGMIKGQLAGEEVEYRAYDQKLFICPLTTLSACVSAHKQVLAANAKAVEGERVTALGLLSIMPAEMTSSRKAKESVGLARAEGETKLFVESPELLRWGAAGDFSHIQKNGCRQQLKKLFQASRVPQWLRHDYPVLIYRDALVALPGIAVADEFAPRLRGELHDEEQKSACILSVGWRFTIDLDK